MSDRNEHTTWTLSKMAECADPDEHDGRGFSDDQAVQPRDGSPGAEFLRRVESDAFELADELRDTADTDRAGSYVERADYDGRLHERADSAVPVYTFDRWKTFVDLGAWDEDVSELGANAQDLTGSAGIALYMIAERLLGAILDEIDPDDDAGEDGE